MTVSGGIIRTREIAWKDEDAVNWRADFPVGWEGFAFSIPTKKGETREFSLRLAENDPWDDFFDGWDKSEVFEGMVTSVYDYGAFVEIEPGITGLLHKSQLPPKLQPSILDLFWYGDRVLVIIREVDHELRQIGLSLAPAGKTSGEEISTGRSQPIVTDEAGMGMEQILKVKIPRRHILVVEDEVSQSKAICGWLREMGQSVDAVDNAEDAIDFLSRILPDIVLVDVGLPTMSGTDLTRFILQNYPQVQAVNATDWARANDIGDTLDEPASVGGKTSVQAPAPGRPCRLSFIRAGSRGRSRKAGRGQAVRPKKPGARPREDDPRAAHGVQKTPGHRTGIPVFARPLAPQNPHRGARRRRHGQ
ncbi:MAG: S1 RNA-binding domain-containing protein [Chloroflexi bacterium]|nr:S1 RNA-binding domain-containing protein [Chloroflexota bacterium]